MTPPATPRTPRPLSPEARALQDTYYESFQTTTTLLHIALLLQDEAKAFHQGDAAKAAFALVLDFVTDQAAASQNRSASLFAKVKEERERV